MSTPARTILRCKLDPSQVGVLFTAESLGGQPKLYRGGGIDFWFFFTQENSTEPMDVTNMADLYLMVKATGGSWSTIGSTVSFNPACTYAQFAAGQSAHAIITLLGSATNLAAGSYDLTVKGHTTDDAVDLDCFGISKLTILDVGLTDAAPEVADAETVESVVRGLLNGYLTPIGKPGVFRTEVSPSGLWRITRGIDDNGEDYIVREQVS
jgi:hypothetical protein